MNGPFLPDVNTEKTYVIDPANAICVCGHWTDEHGAANRSDRGIYTDVFLRREIELPESDVVMCDGCAVNGTTDSERREFNMLPVEHIFQLDLEQSSPEWIADRGGDPLFWPQYVKDYFGPDKMTEWSK